MLPIQSLQSLWSSFVAFAGDDVAGHPALFTAAVVSTVVTAGLCFSLVDVFVTKKVPLKKTALYLAITLPGYLLVFALLKLLPIATRWPVPNSVPSLWVFTRDLVVCFLVGDVLSYWWHRFEHGSKLMFKNVHYVHHKVSRPLSVWSGFYVHPVESLGVFIMFYIYPFIVGVHPIVFITYAVLNTFITMVTHCGYDIPGYPKALFASAPMHEHHHEGGVRTFNFCVLLTLSDRLFGTYKKG